MTHGARNMHCPRLPEARSQKPETLNHPVTRRPQIVQRSETAKGNASARGYLGLADMPGQCDGLRRLDPDQTGKGAGLTETGVPVSFARGSASRPRHATAALHLCASDR